MTDKDNVRLAIGYLQLVIANGNFWPEEIRDLETAISILNRKV